MAGVNQPIQFELYGMHDESRWALAFPGTTVHHIGLVASGQLSVYQNPTVVLIDSTPI